jgi:hypothetical protein
MLFDEVEAIPLEVPSGTGLGLELDRDSIGDAVSITDRGG